MTESSNSPLKKKDSRLLKVFAAEWAIICILIFILIPGRLDFLHGTLLDNAIHLPEKLAGFQPVKFAADILFSFLKILVIFLVFTFTGSALIPSTHRTEMDQSNKKDDLSFIVFASSAFLAGHLIFATVFFALAYFKQLSPLTITIVLSAGLLINLSHGYKRLIRPIREIGINLFEPFKTEWKTLNILSAVMLFSTLLFSSSRLSYDSVYLYFSDPKATAVTSGLHFFQGNIFPVSAFQTTIQFAAIISIFGDQTARMFSWISGCLVIIFSLGIASKVGLSGKAKSVLTAMLLSTTALTDLLGDGKVDLTSTAIVLAAIYWILIENSAYEKFLAGIFTGLAMSSRPYNIFLLGLFVALIYIINAYRDKRNPKVLKNFIGSALLIGAGALIPMALNLFANWAIFGNPLAMFSDASGLPADKWQWAFDPNYIWVIRLLIPFAATFLNTPQSLGGLTPIFLGFMPLMFIGDMRKRINLSQPLGDLLIVTIITLTLWVWSFFTVIEIRYVFFLWIILYMPISEISASVFENKRFPLQKLLSVTVGILMIFNIARVILISLDTYAPLDVQGNPQCHDFILCDYMKPINDEAPQGVRILTLNAFRYYLRTDLLTCSTGKDEYQALRNASLQSPNAFWEEVYRQGYSYIAYEKNYSVRHLYIEFEPNPGNTPLWMELVAISEKSNEGVSAYKINITGESSLQQKKQCLQNNGVWEAQYIPDFK